MEEAARTLEEAERLEKEKKRIEAYRSHLAASEATEKPGSGNGRRYMFRSRRYLVRPLLSEILKKVTTSFAWIVSAFTPSTLCLIQTLLNLFLVYIFENKCNVLLNTHRRTKKRWKFQCVCNLQILIPSIPQLIPITKIVYFNALIYSDAGVVNKIVLTLVLVYINLFWQWADLGKNIVLELLTLTNRDYEYLLKTV